MGSENVEYGEWVDGVQGVSRWSMGSEKGMDSV